MKLWTATYQFKSRIVASNKKSSKWNAEKNLKQVMKGTAIMISLLFIEPLKMASSKLMLILRKTWLRSQEQPSLTSTYIQTLLAKSINVNMPCQVFNLAVARLSSVLPAQVPRSLPTSKAGLCHRESPVVAACASSRLFNRTGAVVEARCASTKA